MEKKVMISNKIYSYEEKSYTMPQWLHKGIFILLSGIFKRLLMVIYFLVIMVYLLFFIDTDRYPISRKAIYDVIHELANKEPF